MKRTQIKLALCATGLALTATTSFAQAPFTPATPGATVTTTTTTTPIVVPVAIGARVVDIVGTPVGRIENIVMSPVGCAEAALVVSTTGRIIPVPWTLIRASEPTAVVGVTPGANLMFTINVEQARLAQAPSFTRSQLPDMRTTAFLQPSLNFFNVSATATGGASGTSTSISGGTTNAAGGIDPGSRIGDTATGAGSQDRFGTTATGGTNQSRFGGTATRVPTNSTGILPPTGRPTPTRPPFDQPNTPPTTPSTPATPDNGALTPPSSPSSPSSPTAPPSSTPAPRPVPPRSSPSTQP